MNYKTSSSERNSIRNAKVKAIETLHEYNDIAHVFEPQSSYQFELDSLMKDAVELGIEAANETNQSPHRPASA